MLLFFPHPFPFIGTVLDKYLVMWMFSRLVWGCVVFRQVQLVTRMHPLSPSIRCLYFLPAYAVRQHIPHAAGCLQGDVLQAPQAQSQVFCTNHHAVCSGRLSLPHLACPAELTDCYECRIYFHNNPINAVLMFMMVGAVYFGYGIYIFEREANASTFTFAGSLFLSLECMLTGYPADAYEVFMPEYVPLDIAWPRIAC